MSILAHTKELLRHLLPAIQRMPKIERIDGAGVEMKRAAFNIIAHFTIAYYCPERREEYIRTMIGDYARLQAAFEIALLQGIIMESKKLPVAERMERIEKGISRWRTALSSQRQERHQCPGKSSGDASSP